MEPWSIEDDLTTDEWQLTDLTSVSTWERVITDLDVLIEDRMKEAKIRIRNHLYTWQDLSRWFCELKNIKNIQKQTVK